MVGSNLLRLSVGICNIRPTRGSMKRMAIAPQITTLNRRATVRKSNDLYDAKGSRLSSGASTTDRKIVPPIQLTAAII